MCELRRRSEWAAQNAIRDRGVAPNDQPRTSCSLQVARRASLPPEHDVRSLVAPHDRLDTHRFASTSIPSRNLPVSSLVAMFFGYSIPLATVNAVLL